MPDRTLRAGVLGLRRGLSFVRLLRAVGGVEVVAVADVDAATRERVRREHDVPIAVATLAELLDVGLDVLVDAAPLPFHVPYAIEALERGVDVLSEVPAAATLDECEALIAAVERTGRRYMMAQNTIYWGVVDAARQMRERGDFGRVFYAEAEYIHDVPNLRRDALGNPTWRATLEPIRYITHSLGPIVRVTGAYPHEVSCYSATGFHEPGYHSLQVAIFKMTDGSVARVTISFANAHWTHHRYAYFGTAATLDTGSVGQDEVKFFTPSIPHARRPARLPLGTDIPGAPAVATQGGHGTAEWFMVQDFLRALREGTPEPVDVYDAAILTAAGIGARDSADAGHPVAIPQFQLRRPDRARCL